MSTPCLFTLPAPVDYVPDVAITTAIQRLFAARKGVLRPLKVTTAEGIVELAGGVDNLLARQRAEEIAQAVHGVRGVVSRLTVEPVAVPDVALQAAIAYALADDLVTREYPVHAAVSNGEVTLTGTLQSWAEKELVLRVLRGVRGVRHLLPDALRIGSGGVHNTDEQITNQIRERLEWDIRVNSTLIEVRTNGQVVHLSGTVGTAVEKTHVVAVAYQAGATRVDARDLFVAYWALDQALRPDKVAFRTDEAITRAVRDSFQCNPRVVAATPLLQVRNGVVTLAGTVNNLRAKQEAEQDARHVVGVCQVHNLLKVRPRRAESDDAIRQTLLGALARDPDVGQVNFSAGLHNGTVYLYGVVDNLSELEQAGDVAAGIAGVVEVINRVEVTGSSKAAPSAGCPAGEAVLISDHTLAERTRRLWRKSLPAQAVEVQVENGRATLTGTVHTVQQRQQAAHDAYEAGARDVNNHLRVAAAPRPVPPVPYLVADEIVAAQL